MIKHQSEPCRRSDLNLIKELADPSRSRWIEEEESILDQIRVDICGGQTSMQLISEPQIY